MQLISLQIHNFRGIRDFATPIEFHEYTLLVGANNSGKSTVIDAIRAFYEKDRYRFTPERDMPKGVTGEESWIELGFELSPEEYTSLKSEYQIEPNRLVVRKYFVDLDSNRTGKIFAYIKDANGERVLAREQFYGANNIQIGKFGQVIYIPALSKVDDATKMSGPSALRDLITDIVGDSISSTTAYRSLTESINEFSQDILQSQNPSGQSIRQLQQEINSELGVWNINTQFAIEPPAPSEIIKNLFQLSIQDKSHGGELAVEQFGSGFQRQFVYTLIKMRAKYQQPATRSVTKDFQPDMTLLLFEEPEAFLHPQQQELLARELRKLAQNGTFQVVCSTHSTNFVSRQTDDITAIVRMQKNSQGYVRRHQITENQWKNILQQNINTLQNIQDVFKNIPDSKVKLLVRTDDYQTEMEEIKNFMFLNPERSSIFFANSVLLVEGYSEYVLIQRLFADSHISQGDSGFFALECMGKYKLLSFMRLLDALGIPHAVIHDDDQRNNSEPNTPLYNAAHAKVNQMITDAQTPHTKKIHMFSPDLEKFLKISHPGSDQRKPQHILYLYAQGQIKVDRLNEFCQIVNDCIAATRV